MTGTDHMIRWSAVAGVAGMAVWVSYIHAWDVVRTHDESGMVDRLYPGTLDGLIYTRSMVLLDAARRGVRAPALALWYLVLKVVA